jgi:hypothetical protein
MAGANFLWAGLHRLWIAASGRGDQGHRALGNNGVVSKAPVSDSDSPEKSNAQSRMATPATTPRQSQLLSALEAPQATFKDLLWAIEHNGGQLVHHESDGCVRMSLLLVIAASSECRSDIMDAVDRMRPAGLSVEYSWMGLAECQLVQATKGIT